MYLTHTIQKKNKLLEQGSKVTDIKQISDEPVLYAATINGDKYCLSDKDLTEVKIVKKK